MTHKELSAQRLNLPAQEVHVWRFCLERPDAVVEELTQQLSADERERAEKFHFEKDRRRWIVCRGVLRTLLAAYVEVQPDQLVFRYGTHGKPALVQWSKQPIEFSVAHAADRALVAVTRDVEIGVDLESIRPLEDEAGMARLIFSSKEHPVYGSLPEDERLRAFFQAWTRKEALVKAVGLGLSIPPAELEVGFASAEALRALCLPSQHFGSQPWQVMDLDVFPSFAAALAIHGSDYRVLCWDGFSETPVD